MKISIIAETADYVVINKPAGVIVHPDGKRDTESLVDWVMESYPDITDVGEPFETQYRGESVFVRRPGIVHRLDRDTSGVMVIARTQLMYECLKQQFKDRQISKEYRAVVLGVPPESTYTVNIPIGRDLGSIEKWRATRDPKRVRGELRDALTYVQVLGTGMAQVPKPFLARHPNDALKKVSELVPHFVSYIRAVPKTGRTHQIRVHLQYLGYPVLGDRMYGTREIDGLVIVQRGLLHAHILKFQDMQGNQISFSAPIPPDMVQVMISMGMSQLLE